MSSTTRFAKRNVVENMAAENGLPRSEHSVLGKLDAMRSTLISQQNELNLILSRRRLFESSTRCPENSSVWEQP